MTASRYLHLAADSSAAGTVEEALRRLGRDDRVLGMCEWLAAGPLHDVDAQATSRSEWWVRILGALDPMPSFDDSDLWAQARTAAEDIVLWHGPHPSERLFALRACWHLRERPIRVHEIALPVRPGGRVPTFFSAAALWGPDALTVEWSRLARVPDVDDRARRWVELRDRAGDWLRILDGEAIIELPVTAFDADLLAGCAGGWKASLHVVGRILAEKPTSLSLLVWRVRELLQSGMLDGRGELNDIALPAEIRSGG